VTDHRYEMRIARFASDKFVDARALPLMAETVGQRFDRIEVDLTIGDYVNPNVQEWIKRLFTRVGWIDHTPVVITVVA
jgi:hypothetical protein